MLKNLLFIAGLLSCTLVYSQTRTVTGTVTEKSGGAPVVGANVIIKGTTSGTVTDASGKFSLSVGAGESALVVSFVGFETTEVALNASGNYLIELAASSNELEVVVT
ncbi:MAG: carboxypeptidase-like regulatory domain-containing protein, partial [Bacteroidota bacterium]